MVIFLTSTAKCDNTWPTQHHSDGQAVESKKMNCGAFESQVARPYNFFLWGYTKDAVFASSLPTASLYLKHRITEAMVSITREMLVKVWDKLEYGTNASHVTCEAHTECL
jgi:hypothetical protein